ncbi:hypothetical protein BGZ82_000366 [Podila clonocystis]|nr:hypothetical protein BGZ82_000366 [Podila clonocystis]
MPTSSKGSCSHSNCTSSGAINSSQDAGTEDTDAIVPEFEDYISALLVQMLVISDDRKTGQLGKCGAGSDVQIAIEHMLQEARELEQSYQLAKCLSDEMRLQDNLTRNDRELAEQVARQDSRAETSLQTANTRFQVLLQHFNTTSDCCVCSGNKQTYIAPCGHAYCEECARSHYRHALTNRTFIPVRCCKVPFASDIAAACLTDESDINKYDSIKCEIENPCPPAVELDLAALKVISENDWKELNRILNERIGNDDPGTVRYRLQNVLRNYYQHEHNWQSEAPYGRICNICSWNMPLYCMHCEVCMETRCRQCAFNN